MTNQSAFSANRIVIGVEIPAATTSRSTRSVADTESGWECEQLPDDEKQVPVHLHLEKFARRVGESCNMSPRRRSPYPPDIQVHIDRLRHQNSLNRDKVYRAATKQESNNRYKGIGSDEPLGGMQTRFRTASARTR